MRPRPQGAPLYRDPLRHLDALFSAAGESEWPNAGNRLIHRHLAGARIAPDEPRRLHRIVDGR